MENVGTTNFSIGDRVRYYRMRRGLSQQALGELIGRTDNWIYRIEHGIRPVDRLSVLLSLAEALRVDISDLVGMDMGSGGQGPQHDGVPGLRRVLSRPPSHLDTGGSPMTTADLKTAVESLWRTYETERAQRYRLVGERLPALLGAAHTTLSAAPTGEEKEIARHVVSLYGLAQIWLRRVGEHTLARVAADRGLSIADETGDPELRAAAAWSVACVLTSSGDVADSMELAREMIDHCSVDDTSPEGHIAAVGALHLQGAVAAMRADRGPTAWDMLRQADRFAARITPGTNHWHTVFGECNVAMHGVHLAAEEGNAAEALRLADDVHVADSVPLERRTRYTIEVMNCNRVQKDDYATVFMLNRLREQSPEEIVFSPLVRDAVVTLMKRERPLWADELRKVAHHIGVA
ncbi:helix-turn-helix domain-containing protein [Streptomyces calidiresistens]|uniref:Helix-turn-helix domain-containing protein n=1 Tax=Streptomyces calidiresistens TaxID=1485586 RepID=A0A7W3XWM3_9ACTN|nr:helix-turn-helix transcriptional regulator [Streptomyces calidiresistens]MBB0229882.1 helix-turn-helix domain-containing protein [Streptomyces calidiresistens]